MATITEDYVSFETAKLLKEKGFNEACNRVYQGPNLKYTTIPISPLMSLGEFGGFHPKQLYVNNNELGDIAYTAPTLQMACKWLREKYNLFIEIQCYGCGADEEAHFEFSFVVSEFMQFDNKICTTVGLKEKKAKSQHNTYEEACEAAIKYCLENLI